MADDGEWHTVTPKHSNAPSKSSHNSRPRRKSGHPQKPKEHKEPKEHKKKVVHKQTEPVNPFHQDEDSSAEEEENENQVDPIDLPVPPYHTTIVVSCPLSDCESSIPFLDTTSLAAHLKDDHKVIFKNFHHMYMALDAYLARWTKELSQKPLSEFGQLNPESNVYTIDPETCTLDKEIREEMQRAKLNEVLKIQQDERETDSKVPRKCLFCKIVCDNRATLFRHMFAEHNFNIGLPDNLVHVNEFLDTLEAKLSKLQCLYCEKTFTSPAVLRKHMRKKKHFKIASKNRQYDRFYVINYLEPGKNWESFENDVYESDDEKKDESWADWEEDVQESTMCLFDAEVLPSPRDALDHMKAAHGFNLYELRKTKGLDFYQTIVLINYIRHQNSIGVCFSCEKSFDESGLIDHLKDKEGCIKKFVSMDAPFWKDPRFLIPTYENDPLLTGFEQDSEDEDEDMTLSDTEANKRYLHEVMERSLSISEESKNKKK